MRSNPIFAGVAVAMSLVGASVAQSELERPAWQGKGIKPASPDHPLQEIISGLHFRTKETQACRRTT